MSPTNTVTTTTQAPTTLILGVLFVGAFVMGCAEMLVVGLIDLISADLAVSVPAAGALVTANALGLAIGGPLLTFATTRFDRRLVLLVSTAVFVAGEPAAGARRRVHRVPRRPCGDRRRAGTLHRRRDDDGHVDRPARARWTRDGDS